MLLLVLLVLALAFAGVFGVVILAGIVSWFAWLVLTSFCKAVNDTYIKESDEVMM